MGIFFELIGEFFIDCCIERANNKKINIMHRIISLSFLTLIYSGAIVLFVTLIFNSHNVVAKILDASISIIFFLFIARLWWKVFKRK
ncbi:hypothetical protein [Clostridium tarantellae]|uniref:Uncharacterized protein n=1 Tax=Clostridium tarantellae TaxID=39493 RepID=A0A6I1MMX6_9CLOT|nr:hypothetical protein [Clostridium tarantellae]MPQ44846.1 hypothetical protein [Clostridium tarantellae]